MSARASMLVAGLLALAGSGCDRLIDPDPPDEVPPPDPVSEPALYDEPAAAVEHELEETLLEQRVTVALLGDLGVEALRMRPVAEGGQVDLTGMVRSQALRERATEVAADVPGVDDIDNGLQVPGATERTPEERPSVEASEALADALLAARVRIALLEELGTDGLELTLDADHGTVALEGTVPDADTKVAAVEAAQGVEGVEHVTDRLSLR